MTAVGSDSLPDIGQRYFTSRPAPLPLARSTRNHRLRATAKRIASSKHQHFCEHAGWNCHEGLERGLLPGSEPRCKYGPGLSADAYHNAHRYLVHGSFVEFYEPERWPRRSPGHRSIGVRVADEDDISLAKSSVVLPGDGSRRRCPSLERQDAFCDSSSRKVRVVRQPLAADEDAQIAELYEAGLLYDDANAASQPLTLDSIAHDEPTYPIRFIKKPVSRRRFGRAAAAGANPHLSLDLSFSNIGDDERVLSLASSPRDALAAIQHAPRSVSPPMRVVYELGSPSSIDIDASQPPELEYDHMSDVDLEELSSQEVDADAANPTETWVMLGDGL